MGEITKTVLVLSMFLFGLSYVSNNLDVANAKLLQANEESIHDTLHELEKTRNKIIELEQHLDPDYTQLSNAELETIYLASGKTFPDNWFIMSLDTQRHYLINGLP